MPEGCTGFSGGGKQRNSGQSKMAAEEVIQAQRCPASDTTARPGRGRNR